MRSIDFVRREMAAAIGRGVRQCVLIGSRSIEFRSSFARGDGQHQTFVPGPGESLALSAALSETSFDGLKATIFVWLGDAGYHTLDAALTTLIFIASLPKESAVILDYAVEKSSLGSLVNTALDGLSSRIACAGDNVKTYIDPQALTVLLRGLGFRSIVHVPHDELQPGCHLVSALV